MKKKLILASGSPRRRELLAGLGLPFEVRVLPGIDESYPDDLPASEVALYISSKKAAAYSVAEDELVVTADTVVVLGDEIMGKPKDEDDARRMLRELSGRTHHVITGVCMKTAKDERHFSVTTEVDFRNSQRRRSTIISRNTIPWTRPVPTAFRSGSAMWASPGCEEAITM